MQRGKKRKGNGAAKPADQPVWQIGLKGLALSWVVTLLGLLLTTCLIYFEWMGSGLIGIAAKVILIGSMLVGGIYVFKKTSGKDRIWVLVMLVAYLAVRFLLSMILTFL